MVAEKTFKREYAFILFVILLHQIYSGNVGMVELIIWPIMSFIATSAGLHIYGKSTVNRAQDGGNG